MSLYESLVMSCLKRADQAAHGAMLIWAHELEEAPNQQDVMKVETLLNDLTNGNGLKEFPETHSFIEENPIPENLSTILEPTINPENLDKLSGWKKYFNDLNSFYLIKAEEFARKQDKY